MPQTSKHFIKISTYKVYKTAVITMLREEHIPALWASSCSWLCKVKFAVCFLCLCPSSPGKILYEDTNQWTPAEALTWFRAEVTFKKVTTVDSRAVCSLPRSFIILASLHKHSNILSMVGVHQLRFSSWVDHLRYHCQALSLLPLVLIDSAHVAGFTKASLPWKGPFYFTL